MTLPTRFVIIVLFATVLIAEAPAQLARQWVARFSGSTKNANNVATAMAVDGSGNVIVTGWVTRQTSGIDFGTVKYSPDGAKLYEAYYTGSGNGIDKAVAVAVDTGLNVYVTGFSNGGASGFDYVTVKYDSTLTQIWAATYNGPGNGEDEPSAIAVNDSLNVYVTGWSMGSGTGFDYATLKYDALGALKWEKRYNGPAGTATDSALAMVLRGTSDLYVTGASTDTMLDYATIKYNAATGDSIWLQRYNGPGNGNDIARAIALRSSTEIFVTGGSQDSASGLPADYDYATIGYLAAGTVDWVARYNGTADGDDQAYAIALNGSSSVFVTGRSLQTGSFNDMVTVRYLQGSGNEDWASAYNGTANDDDGGVAITGSSKPYALGSSAGAGVGQDYALPQYKESNGAENFSVRYNGAANSDDVPHAIISSGGAVYVTGTSKKAKGSEWLTIKYVDPNKMKYRTFPQDSFAVKAANIKTSAPNAGNVRDEAMTKAYPKIKKGFAGYPGGLVVGNARPDSASSYGWMRFDKGKGVSTYLPDTGHARGFDLYGADPFLGEKKNPKKDKHDNHLAGGLIALRVNIGASDAEVTPPTLGDLTYDDGDTSNHYNGMTLRAIATLVDNYLTYWKKYPSVDWIHLDSIFARVNRSFTGPLGVVSKTPLVVTGAVLIDSIPFLGPAIAPLVEPLSFPPGSLDLTPEQYALYQNYPNPFNPTTTIEFDLSQQSVVSLKVYDVLGREVATLLDNEPMDEGYQQLTFDASNLSSGMYFYRLNVDDGQFQQMKKMMLIK